MSPSAPRLVAALLALAVLSPAASRAASDPPVPPTASVNGIVLDASGARVAGAALTLRVPGQPPAETVSDPAGLFVFDRVPAGTARLDARVQGFASTSLDLVTGAGPVTVRIVLQPLPLAEQITVRAETAPAGRILTATRTATPLRDVPQAVSVVSRETIAALGMQGLADVLRYVPGVGTSQGEGNRDAAVFRGSSSTADFFVDGIRDDVQYYRDLYNVDRVEVLKGANAMIFGRGGAGGVLNRVTREAGWNAVREAQVQAGSFDGRRASVDLDQPLTRALAARVTGVYENSGSYRDGVGLERYGVNPTVSALLGTRTLLTVGYERFHDARTADRGVPSFEGRPVPTSPSVFFGDPDASWSRAAVDAITAAVQTNLGRGFLLRNRTRLADYDKFYQNVYPTGVNTAGTQASLSAYNNATRRRNVFTQTDVIRTILTGSIRHTLLAGAEFGRQETSNLRKTGHLGEAGTTSVLVPIDAPTVSIPASFRPSATDADNAGVATVRAVYVQDQAALSRAVSLVMGLRYEAFEVDVHDNRNGADLRSIDHLLSPRVGVVVKPVSSVSLYTSYSLTYLPRAGEQLSSLSLVNQALEPEQFRNYEVGAKWEPLAGLSMTAAVYRLDRRNVAVADPSDPARLQLLAGQRARGVELEAAGRVTGSWRVIAGYAYQDGEITRSLSASARAGARLAQLPAHSFSMWNQCDLTRKLGAGVGLIRRSAMFTSTDNTVVLPAFTRVDAALYVALTAHLRAQANIENVLDRRYDASANGNHNITPGSPRALRVILATSF